MVRVRFQDLSSNASQVLLMKLFHISIWESTVNSIGPGKLCLLPDRFHNARNNVADRWCLINSYYDSGGSERYTTFLCGKACGRQNETRMILIALESHLPS